MNDSDFPMIEVEPMPAWRGTVTQWRAANGIQGRTGNTARSTRRWRVAWSPSEAADLAGVPIRTLYQWATGSPPIVDPTFLAPRMGITKERYSVGDVLRLRVAYDLREAGLSTHIARLVAEDVDAGYRPDNPEDSDSLAAYLALHGPTMLVPADDATADLLMKEHYGVLVHPVDTYDPEDRDLHPLVEHPDLPLLAFPIERRVNELAARADLWWRKVGVPGSRRPPWLT